MWQRILRRLRLAAGDQSGLTLLEVSAAIGISIILALTIILAMVALVGQANNHSAVQTLSSVQSAAGGYFSTNGGSFSGISAQAMQSEIAGGTFVSSDASKTGQITIDTAGLNTAGYGAISFGVLDRNQGCLWLVDITPGASAAQIDAAAGTNASSSITHGNIWWVRDHSYSVVSGTDVCSPVPGDNQGGSLSYSTVPPPL